MFWFPVGYIFGYDILDQLSIDAHNELEIQEGLRECCVWYASRKACRFSGKVSLTLFYFTQKNHISPYCTRNINFVKILILISQTGRLGEGNRRQFEFSLHPLNTQISLNLIYIFHSYRAVNKLHLGYINQSVNVV